MIPLNFQDLGYIDPTNLSHWKFSPTMLQLQKPRTKPKPAARPLSMVAFLTQKELCFQVVIHLTNGLLPCYLRLGESGKMHA